MLQFLMNCWKSIFFAVFSPWITILLVLNSSLKSSKKLSSKHKNEFSWKSNNDNNTSATFSMVSKTEDQYWRIEGAAIRYLICTLCMCRVESSRAFEPSHPLESSSKYVAVKKFQKCKTNSRLFFLKCKQTVDIFQKM